MTFLPKNVLHITDFESNYAISVFFSVCIRKNLHLWRISLFCRTHRWQTCNWKRPATVQRRSQPLSSIYHKNEMTTKKLLQILLKWLDVHERIFSIKREKLSKCLNSHEIRNIVCISYHLIEQKATNERKNEAEIINSHIRFIISMSVCLYACTEEFINHDKLKLRQTREKRELLRLTMLSVVRLWRLTTLSRSEIWIYNYLFFWLRLSRNLQTFPWEWTFWNESDTS